ncbi:MAG: ethanolamine utilization protein EutN [Planctomycetota bacterium]|nr:MAG: ethanolamine utilization protein EutN [Planctomycetota bacterium]
MPQLAKVIGTIWATRKYKDLEGASMRLIQPITPEGKPIGKPMAAVDTIGAGLGERVLYITAYEAVIPYPKDLVPIDASIIAIIEQISKGENEDF